MNIIWIFATCGGNICRKLNSSYTDNPGLFVCLLLLGFLFVLVELSFLFSFLFLFCLFVCICFCFIVRVYYYHFLWRYNCQDNVFIVSLGARCSSVVRAFAHGAMDRRIDPSWWTHWAISRSSQCTMFASTWPITWSRQAEELRTFVLVTLSRNKHCVIPLHLMALRRWLGSVRWYNVCLHLSNNLVTPSWRAKNLCFVYSVTKKTLCDTLWPWDGVYGQSLPRGDWPALSVSGLVAGVSEPYVDIHM